MGERVLEAVKAMRGIKTPLSGLTISRAAEPLGLFVPIPYWAKALVPIKKKPRRVVMRRSVFMIKKLG